MSELNDDQNYGFSVRIILIIFAVVLVVLLGYKIFKSFSKPTDPSYSPPSVVNENISTPLPENNSPLLKDCREGQPVNECTCGHGSGIGVVNGVPVCKSGTS